MECEIRKVRAEGQGRRKLPVSEKKMEARVVAHFEIRVLVWRPLEGAPLAWLTSVVWVPTRHNEAIAAFTDAVGEGLAQAGHRPIEGSQTVD
ncbi:hypothetical protein [Streptomyces sp. NPDC000994]